MHIKKIKGREYYYESKRIGKKVTSVYIGPVNKNSAHGTEVRKLEEDGEAAEQSEEFYV